MIVIMAFRIGHQNPFYFLFQNAEFIMHFHNNDWKLLETELFVPDTKEIVSYEISSEDFGTIVFSEKGKRGNSWVDWFVCLIYSMYWMGSLKHVEDLFV